VKPTVRTLLERGDLALTPLVDESHLPDGALDAPVPWVHSSDLEDPAPFLEPGQVLLTTGTEFGTDAVHDDP
jgi:purine catabolism regulator